jgi:hypothetical protein
MQYIILGTAHELQPRHPGLKAIVLNLAKANAVKLIAEEVREGCREDSVAAKVAKLLGLPRRVLIDMTKAERTEAGINDALDNRPRFVRDEKGKEVLDNNGDFIARRCYLRHADGIREEHWLNRVEEIRPQGNVLIICGYMHRNFLAEKIKKRCDEVLRIAIFPPHLSETTFEILD